MNNIQVIIKMLKLIKPLILPMLVAIFMGVLGFICAIAIPIVASMTLLQCLNMYHHIPTNYLLLILIMLAVLRGVLHYIEQACNHYIAFKLLALIRDRVYTALRRLAPAKLDGRDKGNLISLITNDIELLEVFYAHTISPVIIAFIMMILLLSVFKHLHYIAMIIALVAYLIMAVVIPLVVNKLGKDIGQVNRDEIGNMSSFLLESYRSLPTLLQYQITKQRLAKMNKQSDKIEKLQKNMKDIESIQIIASQLTISLSTMIMFISMFYLYQAGKVNVYQTIMATILMLSSFGPFIALSNLANNLLSTLSSGRRVLTLLEEKELISDVSNMSETGFNDINVSNVTFKYDDEIILNDLSCCLEKDKITGIVGKSGSGKSTLLKLIMRFYDVNSGSIDIGNRNVTSINTKDLRQMFAYVSQETVLFHDTIENNLKIANHSATDDEIISACKKASIHDFIMSLPKGYQTTVSELGSSLSGGEKQRLGLARAFLSKASCILLDEPTSNLDVLNEAIILKALQDNKEQTVVLVTHRNTTMKIADRVIKIDQGRIS